MYWDGFGDQMPGIKLLKSQRESLLAALRLRSLPAVFAAVWLVEPHCNCASSAVYFSLLPQQHFGPSGARLSVSYLSAFSYRSCSTLAWKIPWTEEPGRLQSMGSLRVGQNWSDLAAAAAWGSRGKNTAVVCHSLLQWTTFGQNSPPWPVCLGWPHMAWLTASLSHPGLWSTWLFWLVSCDCAFHFGGCGIVVLASSICPLMDEDKRLVQASDGRCSGGESWVVLCWAGHTQAVAM